MSDDEAVLLLYQETRDHALRVRWPVAGTPVVEPTLPMPPGHVHPYDGPGWFARTPDGHDLGVAMRDRGALAAVATAGGGAWLLDRGDGTTELVVERNGQTTTMKLEGAGRASHWAGKWAAPAKPLRVPPELLRMDASDADGIAIASERTGACLLLRNGDVTPRLAFEIRVSKGDGDTLYASPTPHGLLVTHLVRGRMGAVFHVAEDGTLLGEWEGYAPPPAIWVNEQVLVYDDDMVGRYQVVDRWLRPTSTPDLMLPAGLRPTASGHSTSRRSFAIGDGTTLLVGRLSESNELSVSVLCGRSEGQPTRFGHATELVVSSLEEAVRPPAKPAPAPVEPAFPRTSGPPAFAFPDSLAGSPAWKSPVGTFALELNVRSAGGSGSGVLVEASGAALARLSLEALECQGQTAPFERSGAVWRATLPSLPIAPGVELPLNRTRFDPKTAGQADDAIRASHFELVIRGSAREASRDLLSLAVSVPGGTAAPMKWTRPFVVG